MKNRDEKFNKWSFIPTQTNNLNQVELEKPFSSQFHVKDDDLVIQQEEGKKKKDIDYELKMQENVTFFIQSIFKKKKIIRRKKKNK